MNIYYQALLNNHSSLPINLLEIRFLVKCKGYFVVGQKKLITNLKKLYGIVSRFSKGTVNVGMHFHFC